MWLANWRAVEWSDAFEGECGAPAMHAVTVAGGVQWKEMYVMAAARDRVFVGGASGVSGPPPAPFLQLTHVHRRSV